VKSGPLLGRHRHWRRLPADAAGGETANDTAAEADTGRGSMAIIKTILPTAGCVLKTCPPVPRRGGVQWTTNDGAALAVTARHSHIVHRCLKHYSPLPKRGRLGLGEGALECVRSWR